jgi:hypothetical protein
VAEQEVKWVEGGNKPADDYTFFYGSGNDNHHFGTGFFVCKAIISIIKMTEFISDMMSYITLRGQWCDTDVLNVHAPNEDKNDDMKDCFHKELENVFDQVPKYHTKTL